MGMIMRFLIAQFRFRDEGIVSQNHQHEYQLFCLVHETPLLNIQYANLDALHQKDFPN